MLRMTYRGTTTIPVEAECIRPDRLAQQSIHDITALPVQHGNTQVALGEFFTVAGDASDGEILIEGDCSRVKLLGSDVTSGRLTVQGPVGMHLGAEMSGGTIVVHGSASDWVGAEMKGGRIRVHGNAGHLVGAAYRGSHVGMRGGEILIDGNVGNELGSNMRRGWIVVGGDTGDYLGVGMIAGSIFVFGEPGIRAGAGMKRGTIALFGGQAQLLPTFRYSCRYRPQFLKLYLRKLQAHGFGFPEEFADHEYQRYSGDLVSLGKGEVLIRRP